MIFSTWAIQTGLFPESSLLELSCHHSEFITLLTEVSLALGPGSSSSEVDKQVFSHMIVVVFCMVCFKKLASHM